MLKQSFSPLLFPEARVLILGSLPGDKSIAMNQYYAHPQNRFWKVMAALSDMPYTDDYGKRIEMLRISGFALWDVAFQAQRSGSMDSDIKDEVPNDIEELLRKHTGIRTIAFNGKKAESMYFRFFKKDERIRYLSLPSTSPANAAIGLEALNKAWAVIMH